MEGHEVELCVGGLTLQGVAQGGVETCISARELGVVFDIGRCPHSALKFGTLLASHGHGDHLAGVHYYASQRSLMRLAVPRVCVPIEIVEPLERIFAAWREIEDYDLQVELHGVAPGDELALDSRGILAVAERSVHRVPSLAWTIEREAHSLLPEFQGLAGEEIGRLRKQGVTVTQAKRTPWLCVTGDTQIDYFLSSPRCRSARVLVHEVTSWDQQRDVETTRKWGHTHVKEMIEASERFEGEALVLVHRSLRHSKAQAEHLVAEQFPASVRDRVHVFG